TGDAELRLAGNFDDTLVYNNTFYADQSSGVLVYSGREAAGAAQGADAVPDRLRLLNNIIVHLARMPGLYPLRVVDADLTTDYNNWFRPAGGTLVSWNGTGFVSLDEFRSKSGQERHGVSLDPRFVSADNGHFWLRAVSPMIGRGLAENGASVDLGAFPYRPLLAASPAELRFVTLAGRDPAPQAIEIRSPAEKPLAFAARTGGEPWLRLSAMAGETPAALNLSVRPAGLAPGTYSTTVQIAPALEGEPPFSVRLTLTVVPAPPRRR
ncbi:MAG: hypothetical protein HY238_06335, partial [Acidobacteria bacterium]|nr:hypothetical protein [Acidobacteriota bacterium]